MKFKTLCPKQVTVSMKVVGNFTLIEDRCQELIQMATTDAASFDRRRIKCRQVRGVIGVVDERLHVPIIAWLHLERDCPLVIAASQREANAHDLAPLGVDLADLHETPRAIRPVRHDTRDSDMLHLRLARRDQELEHRVDQTSDFHVVLHRCSLQVELLEGRLLFECEAHGNRCRRETIKRQSSDNQTKAS